MISVFSTLRLHALIGLKGDATECKSKFQRKKKRDKICIKSYQLHLLDQNAFFFLLLIEVKFVSFCQKEQKSRD